MEAPLKQRLIGAIVLAALALIFVPMLLKSPDVRDPDAADVPLQIPDEPNADGIKTIDIPLDKPAQSPIADAPVPMPADADAAPEVNKSIPAPMDDDNPAQAAGQYAVVLSASSDAEAQALSVALKKQGLSSKIQSNGQAFRVRIGPYDSREQAEQARLRSTSVVTGGVVVAMTADAKPAPVQMPVAAPTIAEAKHTATVAMIAPASKPATQVPVQTTGKPEPASTAKGFAVQIGAPASEPAANALRDKAIAAGFSSFIQPVDTESGRRYRVRIGPEHTRDEAKLLLVSAKQKLGIDGIVVTHP